VDRDPTIRVVLGEAEPPFCLLQFVLEGEGIDIVGRAGDDAELERVLRNTSASVVVLDAGISATAAMRVRDLAPSAALVVVWPPDAVAIMAHHRVDPDAAVEDLGRVVRRAAALIAAARDAARALTPVAEPMSAFVPLRSRPPSSSVPVSRTRKRRTVLAAAAMLALYTVALSTIAVAITGGLGSTRGGHAPTSTPHADVAEADAVVAPGFAADAAPSAVPRAGGRSDDVSPGGGGPQGDRVRRDDRERPDTGPGNGNSNGSGNGNAGGNDGNANANGNGNGNGNGSGNGNGNGRANAGGNGHADADAPTDGDRSDGPRENGDGNGGERPDRTRRDGQSRVGSRPTVERRAVASTSTAPRVLGARRTS
jgi:hypothetical protein